MKEKIGRFAQEVAASGTVIAAINPVDGLASIEGYYDKALAVLDLLLEIRRGESQGVSEILRPVSAVLVWMQLEML